MTFAQTVQEQPPHSGDARNLRSIYGVRRLGLFALATAAAAVLVAGFWNYHLVDGFGRDVVAAGTIGDTSELAGSYGARGAGFGFVFAAVAGLAATFTACNCVVFAMLPGLACPVDQSGRTVRPWKALGAFVGGVVAICAAYGILIGLLGPAGVEALNDRPVRLAQAQTVFTGLGIIMLVWGCLELGLLDAVRDRLPRNVVSFWGRTTTRAAAIGSLVGLFAVGRPFPVFREFLTYAASAQSPLYGAGVMMAQGLGQILVMVLLFALLVTVGGRRMMSWATTKPHQPRLLSGLALLGGGVFFVYYWGLAFVLDVGRWGFKLGWYG